MELPDPTPIRILLYQYSHHWRLIEVDNAASVDELRQRAKGLMCLSSGFPRAIIVEISGTTSRVIYDSPREIH